MTDTAGMFTTIAIALCLVIVYIKSFEKALAAKTNTSLSKVLLVAFFVIVFFAEFASV